MQITCCCFWNSNHVATMKCFRIRRNFPWKLIWIHYLFGEWNANWTVELRLVNVFEVDAFNKKGIIGPFLKKDLRSTISSFSHCLSNLELISSKDPFTSDARSSVFVVNTWTSCSKSVQILALVCQQ